MQTNTAAPLPICGLTTPKDVRPWNLPGGGVSRPLRWKMRQLFIFIQAQAEGILIPTWVTSTRKKTSSTLTSSALTLYHQSQFALVCIHFPCKRCAHNVPLSVLSALYLVYTRRAQCEHVTSAFQRRQRMYNRSPKPTNAEESHSATIQHIHEPTTETRVQPQNFKFIAV